MINIIITNITQKWAVSAYRSSTEWKRSFCSLLDSDYLLRKSYSASTLRGSEEAKKTRDGSIILGRNEENKQKLANLDFFIEVFTIFLRGFLRGFSKGSTPSLYLNFIYHYLFKSMSDLIFFFGSFIAGSFLFLNFIK